MCKWIFNIKMLTYWDCVGRMTRDTGLNQTCWKFSPNSPLFSRECSNNSKLLFPNRIFTVFWTFLVENVEVIGTVWFDLQTVIQIFSQILTFPNTIFEFMLFESSLFSWNRTFSIFFFRHWLQKSEKKDPQLDNNVTKLFDT